MDQLISSTSAITLIVAFLTFIIIAIKRYNYKISPKNKLAPGPWKLPIVGNMHQLLMNPLTHRCLAELAKKHGPVMYLKLGELDNVVVSSRQAAEEVLRTNDILLAHRPVTIGSAAITYNCKDILFAPYGEYWRQVRKICVVHLTSAKQVESFRSVRETEVAMFVRSIEGSSSSGSSPVNLSKMLFSITTNIISRATFGDSCERVDAFAPLLARITDVLAGFSIADFFPSAGVLHRISGMKDKTFRLHQDIDEVLESVIDAYKASKEAGRTKAGEILGVLLDLQDESDPETSLSTESIKAILFDLIAAGIETSSTVIEWTMSEIMKHPDVMKKVQEEVREVFHNESKVDEASLHQLKYMDAVIRETLRLHPPAPLLAPREAQKNLTISGYHIPQKTRVLVNAWAIGRDPKIWKDAENFSPERFLTSLVDYKGGHMEFIPFGAGRRMCPGMMFGMSVVELTLANLLSHFNWELPAGLKPESLDMSEVPGLTIRRKHDLCLKATHYCP